MQSINSGRLDFIQALRGVAVFLVLSIHFPGAAPFAASGYAGVDLFFVVSGFVMVVTTANGANVREFLIKRFARVWPAYAVATLAMLVILHPRAMVDDPKSTLIWIGQSLSFWPLWVQMPIDKPGWSLGFEMWFYLLFGLSLLAGSRRWIAYAALTMASMMTPLAFGGMPNLLHNTTALGSDGIGGFLTMITASINWAFPVGVICGLAYVSRERWAIIRSALVANVILIALIAICFCLAFPQRLDHGPLWALPFGGIVLVLALRHKAEPIKVPAVLTFVGDISYSLYVTHWLVVEAFSGTHLFRLTTKFPVNFVPGFLLYLALALALAWPFYVLVERQLSNWVRDRLLARNSREPRPQFIAPIQEQRVEIIRYG